MFTLGIITLLFYVNADVKEHSASLMRPLCFLLFLYNLSIFQLVCSILQISDITMYESLWFIDITFIRRLKYLGKIFNAKLCPYLHTFGGLFPCLEL